MVFLSQKVDGSMIFTDYWKGLVLTISGMGNMGFFWSKKLMERWYLLITGNFLFWTFRWWEMGLFLSQEVDGKMIFTGHWEVLVFWWWEIRSFFSQKVDGKMIFPCEIWFFAQWLHKFDQIIDSQRLRFWNIRCNALKL